MFLLFSPYFVLVLPEPLGRPRHLGGWAAAAAAAAAAKGIALFRRDRIRGGGGDGRRRRDEDGGQERGRFDLMGVVFARRIFN